MAMFKFLVLSLFLSLMFVDNFGLSEANQPSYLQQKVCFKNKVILVTEADTQIGADVACEFAKAGGRVALVGGDGHFLDQVFDRIKQVNGTAKKINADVAEEPQKVIDETIHHFKQLDVVVNIVGLTANSHSISNADNNLLDQVVNKNLRSIILLSKLALPHLQKTKGNIIIVSNAVALLVIKNGPFYCILRAALKEFTRCAALEFGKDGVRVNMLIPGAMQIEDPEAHGYNLTTYKEHKKRFSKLYPVGHIGELNELSAAVLFLASDAASFITGTHLRVDGGGFTAGLF